MNASEYSALLARQMIERGSWIVDAERGLIIGRRYNRPLGYVRRYVWLCIWDGRTRKRYSVPAHRVIWEDVNGPVEDMSLEVNHKNCVKTDNRISNLELTTALGNSQHAYAHGLIPPQPRGHLSPRSKLTELQVVEVLRLLSQGVTQQRIADRLGVSQKTVSNVKLGRRYSNAGDVLDILAGGLLGGHVAGLPGEHLGEVLKQQLQS